ncbi:MAG: hypothetical protein Q8P92_02185 [Candidatus Daviesbacteria bacterium]|nr:hypothetical protein [Candidatus Daviesbacteria bacterium]
MQKNNFFLILIVSFLIFSFWMFWLPGLRVATDYHQADQKVILNISFPWVWREVGVADGLGEYTGSSLWFQPFLSLSGLLTLISIPFWLQTKLWVFLILILGFVSLNKLLKYLRINFFARYVGIFFYLSNSFFLLLIDGGQLSLALTYGVFPLNIYFFLKNIDQSNFKNKLYLSVSILVVSILDIRFVYLLIIIFLIQFLILLFTGNCLKLLKESFFYALLTLIILLGFHSYWLLPTALKPPQLPQTYGRASQVDFLSFSTLGHSLFLEQPHWYKNVFGQIENIRGEFVLIPMLVFLAPILRRRDKAVGFWLIVAILGIFLSKGSQEPLGKVYSWLFSNIPGFSFFRDPVKFYFLTSLSYSILLGITVQEINNLKLKKNLIDRSLKFLPFLILIYLVWLIRPVYLGQMTGLFSYPIYEKEFSNLTENINEDQNFSRTFWIPTKSPLGISSLLHPSVEASRLVQKRPFAIGTIGSYETLNFLREATFMGEIFDVSGIGYIVYPYLDPKRDDMHPDSIRYFYTFSNQLSDLSWLTKVDKSPIPLWQAKKHQDRFFITPNIWWVIGSDDIYNESTKSAQLQLSKNALVFVEEKAGLGQRIDENPSAKIVLNKKTLVDLAASFIDDSEFIFPAKNLDFDPNESGWWKREVADLIRWRDFLQTKYGIDNLDFDLGGGWAVGEGSLKFKVKSEKFSENRMLLARVLESTRSGQLRFYQNGQLIGEINTKKEGNNIRWFEVGELSRDRGELNIESSGDINVVNALAIIEKNLWQDDQDKAKQLQKQNRIMNYDKNNVQDTKTEVTYQKINPTKYKVTVSGLKGEAFLVFSQNYDGLWKLNDQFSLPIYSLLNGFKVEKDGEYIVKFEPQKWVYPGLIVSFITSVFLIVTWVLLRKKG